MNNIDLKYRKNSYANEVVLQQFKKTETGFNDLHALLPEGRGHAAKLEPRCCLVSMGKDLLTAPVPRIKTILKNSAQLFQQFIHAAEASVIWVKELFHCRKVVFTHAGAGVCCMLEIFR